MFKVIFTHHNDDFSKNGRCNYPYGLWGNSFKNSVKTSTYLPIFQQADRKKYLMSFLLIITIFFKNERCDYPYGVTLSKISICFDQIFERVTP